MVVRGDLALLDDPVAQKMLAAAVPARLGYVWTDGTPRTVPIWFHWDGAAIVLGTQPYAPKIKALRANPTVSLTIDGDTFPYPVLLLRGTAAIHVCDDLTPEYAAAADRYFGPERAASWVNQFRGQPMARIRITPTWASVIDFQTRFPSAVESGPPGSTS